MEELTQQVRDLMAANAAMQQQMQALLAAQPAADLAAELAPSQTLVSDAPNAPGAGNRRGFDGRASRRLARTQGAQPARRRPHAAGVLAPRPHRLGAPHRHERRQHLPCPRPPSMSPRSAHRTVRPAERERKVPNKSSHFRFWHQVPLLGATFVTSFSFGTRCQVPRLPQVCFFVTAHTFTPLEGVRGVCVCV